MRFRVSAFFFTRIRAVTLSFEDFPRLLDEHAMFRCTFDHSPLYFSEKIEMIAIERNTDNNTFTTE